MKLIAFAFLLAALAGCSSQQTSTSQTTNASAGNNTAKQATSPPVANDIATRPLSDDDIEKYCAIAPRARKLGPLASGQGGTERFSEEFKKVCAEYGLSTLEYSVISLRVKAALTHLDLENKVPIPADKRADCEIVRKHRDKIKAAHRPQ